MHISTIGPYDPGSRVPFGEWSNQQVLDKINSKQHTYFAKKIDAWERLACGVFIVHTRTWDYRAYLFTWSNTCGWKMKGRLTNNGRKIRGTTGPSISDTDYMGGDNA